MKEAFVPATNLPKPKSILVVENDHDLRKVICAALRDQGFHVYEADSAEEALGILHTQNDIQLVFSEIRLSGKMSGIELADEIGRRFPDIGVLLTSAKIQDTDFSAQFIYKPYSLSLVIASIQVLSFRNS